MLSFLFTNSFIIYNSLVNELSVCKLSVYRTFEGHDNVITACVFTPESSFVVSACASGDLRIWDALYGQVKPLYFDPECHDLGVSGLAISPTFGSAGQFGQELNSLHLRHIPIVSPISHYPIVKTDWCMIIATFYELKPQHPLIPICPSCPPQKKSMNK